MYIYEYKEWPNFTWNQVRVSDLLTEVRFLQGRLLGRIDALGFPLREEATLQAVFYKARFWSMHTGEVFNDRQKTILNRLLDGFDGKLTSSMWAKITKCSQDTALRDITDLLSRQILKKEEAGGRSTSYQLCLP
jgi:Fic family protein